MFLLTEIFGYDYDQIAEIVPKREENCRQIFSWGQKANRRGSPRSNTTA